MRDALKKRVLVAAKNVVAKLERENEKNNTKTQRENNIESIKAVIKYAGLENYDITDAVVLKDGDLNEVIFNAGFMKYDCYVDIKTGEVVGFDSEPVVLGDCDRGIKFTAA
ncbi:MAG: hypothetical protein K6B75_08810 [Lachnospiraceae bacterium]|nr:hypothetical protein [Lachnospiraceae bacterium]